MACTWRKGWMLRNSSLDRGGGSPKSCWVCHFNSSANATRQYGDWFHNWVVLSCFVDWYPYVDLVGQHVLQRTWGKTHPNPRLKSNFQWSSSWKSTCKFISNSYSHGRFLGLVTCLQYEGIPLQDTKSYHDYVRAFLGDKSNGILDQQDPKRSVLFTVS